MRCDLVLVLAACSGPAALNHPDAATDAAVDAGPIAAPDLRFQWVDAAPALEINDTTSLVFGSGAGGTFSPSEAGQFGQLAITPLQLDLNNVLDGNYAWMISSFGPTVAIDPISAVARSGPIDQLDDDLAADLAPGGVITSLDVFPDAYAYVVQSAQDPPGYTVTSSDLARADLDAYATSEGMAGHVITAISASPTAGMLRVYSAARAGDSTVYTTSVLDTSNGALREQAATLAGSFTITACGADGHVGAGELGFPIVILVGTRAAASQHSAADQNTIPADLHAGGALVAWTYSSYREVEHPPPSDDLIVEH